MLESCILMYFGILLHGLPILVLGTAGGGGGMNPKIVHSMKVAIICIVESNFSCFSYCKLTWP